MSSDVGGGFSFNTMFGGLSFQPRDSGDRSRSAAPAGERKTRAKVAVATPASAAGSSTPSPHSVDKNRGRPSEDVLPKVAKMLCEFQECASEHARFFGSEKKTQAKAFDRFIETIGKELSCDDVDADRETALKMAKKKVEIVASLCRGYVKASGFISAFREMECFAKLPPTVELTFVPKWMTLDNFRLSVSMSKSTEMWELLAAMESAGFLKAEIEVECIALLADRIVELGRRETASSLPGLTGKGKLT